MGSMCGKPAAPLPPPSPSPASPTTPQSPIDVSRKGFKIARGFGFTATATADDDDYETGDGNDSSQRRPRSSSMSKGDTLTPKPQALNPRPCAKRLIKTLHPKILNRPKAY